MPKYRASEIEDYATAFVLCGIAMILIGIGMVAIRLGWMILTGQIPLV